MGGNVVQNVGSVFYLKINKFVFRFAQNKNGNFLLLVLAIYLASHRISLPAKKDVGDL